MVQYWIATSNWYETPGHLNRPCSGAKERNAKKIWWFLRERDEIEPGDKAIIYMHYENIEAKKAKIKIDEHLKKRFIGYFTIDRIIDIPNECLSDNNPNSRWIKIKDNSLYPDNKVVLRIEINNDNDRLFKEITGVTNVGLAFKDKTWIKINKKYYDLVMEKLL